MFYHSRKHANPDPPWSSNPKFPCVSWQIGRALRAMYHSFSMSILYWPQNHQTKNAKLRLCWPVIYQMMIQTFNCLQYDLQYDLKWHTMISFTTKFRPSYVVKNCPTVGNSLIIPSPPWCFFFRVCYITRISNWMFPKIVGFPQNIHFNRVFHYKPSILGVPLFLETPNWCLELEDFDVGSHTLLFSADDNTITWDISWYKLYIDVALFCHAWVLWTGCGHRYELCIDTQDNWSWNGSTSSPNKHDHAQPKQNWWNTLHTRLLTFEIRTSSQRSN